jgi:hypothetical protein
MNRKRQRLSVAAATCGAALLFGAASGSAPTAEPTFESQWQDGRAELAGYRYAVTRYGERRSGTAVLITVTEPFSDSKHVKVDHPGRVPGDSFEALKLNFVRDFQTGIYDYNTMVSVFTRSRNLSPVKISFSSAEWCGHVYEELDFEPRRISDLRRSYFEDESGSRSLPWKRDGVAEDQLFLLLRGLRGPFLRPGETRSFPFLPSPFTTRLAHRPMIWSAATATRAASTERVRVPAGSFEADVYTVRVADGREGRFWIEGAHPRRVLKWSWSAPKSQGSRMGGDAADQGELKGSARLPYWQLHKNGDERYLAELGLGRSSAPRE